MLEVYPLWTIVQQHTHIQKEFIDVNVAVVGMFVAKAKWPPVAVVLMGIVVGVLFCS